MIVYHVSLEPVKEFTPRVPKGLMDLKETLADSHKTGGADQCAAD